MTPLLVDIPSAAVLCSVSETTFRAGILPALTVVRVTGRTPRVSVEELKKWLENTIAAQRAADATTAAGNSANAVKSGGSAGQQRASASSAAPESATEQQLRRRLSKSSKPGNAESKPSNVVRLRPGASPRSSSRG